MARDIDVDVPDRDAALQGLPHVPATTMVADRRQRHVSGIYFQRVPVDPFDGLCAFEHSTAGDLGYTKVDLLNNSIYEGVRDEAHLLDLLHRDAPWDFLDSAEIVEQLHHVRNHYDIVQTIKPRSILDLAVVIALIRPGKHHLLNQPREVIDAEIWKPVTAEGGEGYAYKKSHAVAYAASIVVQLNLMVEQADNEMEAG